VPFKAANLKRKGRAVRFCGKTFRVFEPERLEGVKWQQGCFAQDALGNWWLCLPVEMRNEKSVAPQEKVGIDLGLKDVAVTSDGHAARSAASIAGLSRRLPELSVGVTDDRPSVYIEERRTAVRMCCINSAARS
jgi:hypothetical protein